MQFKPNARQFNSDSVVHQILRCVPDTEGPNANKTAYGAFSNPDIKTIITQLNTHMKIAITDQNKQLREFDQMLENYIPIGSNRERISAWQIREALDFMHLMHNRKQNNGEAFNKISNPDHFKRAGLVSSRISYSMSHLGVRFQRMNQKEKDEIKKRNFEAFVIELEKLITTYSSESAGFFLHSIRRRLFNTGSEFLNQKDQKAEMEFNLSRSLEAINKKSRETIIFDEDFWIQPLSLSTAFQPGTYERENQLLNVINFYSNGSKRDEIFYHLGSSSFEIFRLQKPPIIEDNNWMKIITEGSEDRVIRQHLTRDWTDKIDFKLGESLGNYDLPIYLIRSIYLIRKAGIFSEKFKKKLAAHGIKELNAA